MLYCAVVDHTTEAPAPQRPSHEKRLLDATIAAIDAGGEGAVKVQEIADAAGVQIPVLYRKFGSRDGLIQAAHVERLSSALTRELAEIKTAIEAVNTAEEFRTLFDAVLVELNSPRRVEARWKRVNILGSTYGRPALADEVSNLMAVSVDRIADLLRRPHDEGWLREGLDLSAFAAWFAGQALGRVIIELDPTRFDQSAWNEISAEAVRHVLYPRP